MSEPSQLFARVRLSRARYEAFLATSFEIPADDARFFEWLAAAKYYGEPITAQNLHQRVAASVCVRDWVAAVMAPPFPHPGVPSLGIDRYDGDAQTWTLASLGFSESYDDFIPAVAIFRKLAEFLEPGEGGGLLIYRYLFGDGKIIAAMRVDPGSPVFLDETASRTLVAESDSELSALMQRLYAASPEA